MKQARLGGLLTHIRRMATGPDVSLQLDAQLLDRFVQQGEQQAFTEILQRHAQIVWRVCQHVLRREHDAEDAFQATFLVLAQKAPTIRKAGSLASWLYGTAFHIAMRAKRDASRRQQHEQRPRQQLSRSISAWLDLQEIVDEEVHRLPSKQQEVFLLCVLEGQSRAEAALELNWKEGTVSSTLARAKQTLRVRLAQRGVVLSVALAGIAVSSHAARAAPVQEALAVVLGDSKNIPAAVTELARGGAMISTRVKVFTALMLAFVVATGGAALARLSATSKTLPSSDAQSDQSNRDRHQPELSGSVLTFAPRTEPKVEPFAGVKLAHTLSHDVYRFPMFLPSSKGASLFVWADTTDPTVRPRFPNQPLPDPKFDVLVYDPDSGKERYKVSYPEVQIPASGVMIEHSAIFVNGELTPWGRMALAPDGKSLAMVNTSWRANPPSPYSLATSTINLLDLETHKSRPAIKTEFKDTEGQVEVNLLFAPDGTLLILRESTCIVQELDKEKPRITFKFERPEGYKTKPGMNQLYGAMVSSDSKYIAIATDGIVTVYDLDTGKKILSTTRPCPEVKRNHDQNIVETSLAFASSTKGPKLMVTEMVLGGPKDFVMTRIYDLKEKTEMTKNMPVERVNKSTDIPDHLDSAGWRSVTSYFNAAGQPRVVFLDNKDARILDPETGKELYKLDGGAGIQVSPDGKYLMRLKAKGKDEQKFAVEIWKLEGE